MLTVVDKAEWGSVMQGFYVSIVYHSFSIKYGGDVSVLDEAAWLARWVALMKQVLESDVCKVSRNCAWWHALLSTMYMCSVVRTRSWVGMQDCSQLSPRFSLYQPGIL